MKLEVHVHRLQGLLRAFQYGPELDELAEQLLRRLNSLRNRRVDFHNRLQLKALALLAEYLDAHGRSRDAAILLKPTVHGLLDTLGDTADKRLERQRVWCCLAYALTHLRAGRTSDAGMILERVNRFVEAQLVDPDFPCHGTIALLRYYQGLWLRNAGRLDEAARAFDAALDDADLRFRDKKSKYTAIDPDRLRRELVYCRVMTARILGFGHGGIALARGRYLEARGWLIGASQLLAQFGQEHWRKSLEVYARSAGVWIAVDAARLDAERAALQELAVWFDATNERNSFVAHSFALVAEVRLRLRSGKLQGLRTRLVACLRRAYADAGPLTATAALALVDCLLRCGWTGLASRELDRLQRWVRKDAEVVTEEHLLRARIALTAGEVHIARQYLQPLLHQKIANRAHWARAWGLMARIEHHSGNPVQAELALTTAEQAARSAQDGESAGFVQEVALQIRSRQVPQLQMPYQQEEASPLHYDMDHNLEAARLNVIATAHARYPSAGIEDLARAVGRGPSWLYDVLGRHRQLPWVEELFTRKANRLSRGSMP